MGDDLGVGLGGELHALGDQAVLEGVEVLDDAVVDERELAVAAAAVALELRHLGALGELRDEAVDVGAQRLPLLGGEEPGARRVAQVALCTEDVVDGTVVAGEGEGLVVHRFAGSDRFQTAVLVNQAIFQGPGLQWLSPWVVGVVAVLGCIYLIVSLPAIAPVPWTRPWYRGLANMRGRLAEIGGTFVHTDVTDKEQVDALQAAFDETLTVNVTGPSNR